MSKEINGFITWIRSFLDDIYAEKGGSGTDLELNLVPKSQNPNGVVCISGGVVNYDLDLVYPVGSIYMSVNSANPSTLFGGTWVQLTDTFLYATSTTADDNVTTAPTGQGEATHSLTEPEMPRHTHIQNSHNHTQNPHHHDLNRNWSINSGSDTAYMTTQNRKYASVNTKDTTATNNAQTATNKYTGGNTSIGENAGNGVAHNNMPPYMKVYMWKRTQ